MTHILSLEITRFRGVSSSLRIDFRGNDGVPSSLLVIGDNGSGKSSIVDAIEVGLQGSIGRTTGLQQKNVPSPFSFFDSSSATVCVETADNKSIVREFVIKTEGGLEYSPTPHPEFSVSPLVVRRSDILLFWNTPDERRQSLFFRYFNPESGSGIEPPLPLKVRELEDQIQNEKRRYRESVANLAELVRQETPDTSGVRFDLEKWITSYVYGGMSHDERQRRRQLGTLEMIPVRQHKLVLKVREHVSKLAKLKKELKAARSATKESPKYTAKILATSSGLLSVSSFVTDGFTLLSSAGLFVDRIDLELGALSATSLEVKVTLKNGTVTSPQRVFSEANLDLLGLLLYVAIAKQSAERGQAKVLVLDDVFQSVDGTARLRALEYIVQNLQGWQFVLTAHDRLWAEQVRGIFRRMNCPIVVAEISRWSFREGPQLMLTARLLTDGLKRMLESGEVYQICAEAGLLLERACNELSMALPVAVTRRRDDRYTLGDLWPGVLKALKRTDASTAALEVDRWMHLRNLVGAHYNDWAQTLSREEAVTFANSVLALSSRIWCPYCFTWIDAVRIGNKVVSWSCRCQKTSISSESAG